MLKNHNTKYRFILWNEWPVKSLHKVLDVIDVIAESGSAGVRYLSSISGYPLATTHRIVSTLAKRGYLKQDPVTKTYALSMRFVELGNRVQQQLNLTSIARPHLERLKHTTGESANLAVLDGDEVVYLDQVRSDHMLQLFTRLGARVPLYSTGVGKAMMSDWSDREVDEYLARTPLRGFTGHTITNPEEIRVELEKIRKQGFSVDNEEMEEGVRCVAALISDHSGRCVGAVSLSGAAMRVTPARLTEFAKAVTACAQAISSDVGGGSGHTPKGNKRKERRKCPK
jgi:DNA-binding IclR family transcriptional regulator